jgi:hypothetical protein
VTGRQTPLKRGCVYLVDRIVGPDGLGAFGCYLVGVAPEPRHNEQIGYGLHRFRPVYRPKQELISRLLSDVPARVDA